MSFLRFQKGMCNQSSHWQNTGHAHHKSNHERSKRIYKTESADEGFLDKMDF